MSTFWRLLTFLRPYRKGAIWSFVLAFGALIGTVLIPYLTGVAINAVGHHHTAAARAHNQHRLILLALGIVAAALARLVFSALRRLVAGQVSLGVEVDLREALYGQLQRLELSFFDRQQTGQLMSRATVDLQSVRFFLGYGLIFIAQSLVTILLAAVAMFALQPGLAAISLAPVPFVVLIANRYGHHSRPAMQEAQQRIAELTADTEENVSGVRVVKAFAQEDRQLRAVRPHRAAGVRPAVAGHPDPGVLQPDDQLPAQPRAGGDPAVRRPRGDRRVAVGRRLHRLLRLPADAHLPDADARLHARRRPARDRIGRPHLPDPRPGAGDRSPRPTRRPLPEGSGHVRFCAAPA